MNKINPSRFYIRLMLNDILAESWLVSTELPKDEQLHKLQTLFRKFHVRNDVSGGYAICISTNEETQNVAALVESVLYATPDFGLIEAPVNHADFSTTIDGIHIEAISSVNGIMYRADTPMGVLTFPATAETMSGLPDVLTRIDYAMAILKDKVEEHIRDGFLQTVTIERKNELVQVTKSPDAIGAICENLTGAATKVKARSTQVDQVTDANSPKVTEVANKMLTEIQAVFDKTDLTGLSDKDTSGVTAVMARMLHDKLNHTLKISIPELDNSSAETLDEIQRQWENGLAGRHPLGMTKEMVGLKGEYIGSGIKSRVLEQPLTDHQFKGNANNDMGDWYGSEALRKEMGTDYAAVEQPIAARMRAGAVDHSDRSALAERGEQSGIVHFDEVPFIDDSAGGVYLCISSTSGEKKLTALFTGDTMVMEDVGFLGQLQQTAQPAGYVAKVDDDNGSMAVLVMVDNYFGHYRQVINDTLKYFGIEKNVTVHFVNSAVPLPENARSL